MSSFTHGDAGSGKGEWCAFRAGDRNFCLSSAAVLEVLFFPPVTMLPRSPRFLLGIGDCAISARSGASVVPIVDPRHLEASREPLESSLTAGAYAWKYAVMTNAVSNGEGALLAIAADEVWHADATKDADPGLFGPLVSEDQASSGNVRTVRLGNIIAEVLDIGAVAQALRQAGAS
jgi:chemotaxis signal transduction protein